jgi:hypothetical protein
MDRAIAPVQKRALAMLQTMSPPLDDLARRWGIGSPRSTPFPLENQLSQAGSHPETSSTEHRPRMPERPRPDAKKRQLPKRLLRYAIGASFEETLTCVIDAFWKRYRRTGQYPTRTAITDREHKNCGLRCASLTASN